MTVLDAELAPPKVVDRELAVAPELVSLASPESFAADQYRSLRHLMERMRNESDCRVVAISSPTPGEGKTVTTLNLAGAFAQSAALRVLVIDADLRRPSVTQYLPFDASPGLLDALTRADGHLSDVAYRVDRLNLSVVPAGHARHSSYEALSSPRFDSLVAEARARYHYVLIDTPPLLPVPDSRLVGRCVDGFLLVVAARKTPRQLLAEALNLLDPAKVLGMVFNFDDRPLSGYESYYGYGRAYGRSSTPTNRTWWRRFLS